MRSFAVLLAWGVVTFGPAVAGAAPAEKAAPQTEPSMHVRVVRNAHPGCEPNCLHWIAAQGKIDAASPGRFRKVISRLGDRKLPVLIDSAGGSVNDALAIGRMIRARGLDVVVARTEFTPCAPEDTGCLKTKSGGELRGLAHARLSKCASSCAFILAGGRRRFVGAGTGVGVHQITMILRRYQIVTRRSFGVPVERRKKLLSEQRASQNSRYTRNTYGNITRYFAEMGIGGNIMPLITSTPSDKIRWLTAEELRATHLATHFLNGEQLMAGRPIAPPVQPVPTVPPRASAEDACGMISQAATGCRMKAGPDQPPIQVPAGMLPPPKQK
jgi:hypothetical protein